MILRLTKEAFPDGTLIGVIGDVHIPHHDHLALSLAVEAMESAGVDRLVLNGDICDSGPSSRHAGKQKRAVLDEGSLLESIDPGRWFLNWADTRPCIYVMGNHEAWVENQIATDPTLVGATDARTLMHLPARFHVLPSQSRVRLGSLDIEHGDGFFPRGNGGANPAQRIATMAPDQTTVVNHLHRRFFKCWTTYDEHGRPRTRAAYGNPHMSLDDAHGDYAGTYHGWQQGFLLIRVYWEGSRPRFTVYPVDIHRTKRGRPVFELFGKVYK